MCGLVVFRAVGREGGKGMSANLQKCSVGKNLDGVIVQGGQERAQRGASVVQARGQGGVERGAHHRCLFW